MIKNDIRSEHYALFTKYVFLQDNIWLHEIKGILFEITRRTHEICRFHVIICLSRNLMSFSRLCHFNEIPWVFLLRNNKSLLQNNFMKVM